MAWFFLMNWNQACSTEAWNYYNRHLFIDTNLIRKFCTIKTMYDKITQKAHKSFRSSYNLVYSKIVKFITVLLRKYWYFANSPTWIRLKNNLSLKDHSENASSQFFIRGLNTVLIVYLFNFCYEHSLHAPVLPMMLFFSISLARTS